MRIRILAALLCFLSASAFGAWHSVLQVSTAGGGPPLAFTALANGTVGGAAIAGSGTYTGTAPSSLSSATWGGGCSGSSTPASFSASAGTWSATFTVPAGAGTGCTIAITDNLTDTATSPGVTISGGGFAGPGDLKTYVAWYGLRGYSAAYAAPGTNLAAQLIRASDSTTFNVKVLTTGAADVAGATTFCAATTCSVVQWTDQTGNGHTSTAAHTTAESVVSFSGCPGGAAICAGVGPSIATGYVATITSIPQPYTLTAVAYRSTGSAQQGIIITGFNGTGGGMLSFVDASTAGNNRLYCGADLHLSASDGVLHSMIGVCNGASSELSIDDNTPATGNAGSLATSTSLSITDEPPATLPMNGFFFEAGISASAFSPGDISATCHNARIYWGSAGTC